MWKFKLRHLSAICLCFVASALCFALRGCRESESNTTKHVQQDELRQADRGEALLKAAAVQLSDLPAAVDTELRPPIVLLDSRKSADGKDVLATCTANPKVSADVFNVIKVPAGNSRFRSLGVLPGDILKYYVKEDETVDPESRSVGFSRQLAMDLIVAQVIDDSTLLIESGLNQPVTPARKIEIWRYAEDRLQKIYEKLSLYEVYRRPAIGWEPAPDDHVLSQVMAWLNQWIRQSDPKTDWQRDPLLDTLDATLRGDAELAKRISIEALVARAFQPDDARHIQEAIWLRDISRWTHGDGFDDVSRATALFDWTGAQHSARSRQRRGATPPVANVTARPRHSRTTRLGVRTSLSPTRARRRDSIAAAGGGRWKSGAENRIRKVLAPGACFGRSLVPVRLAARPADLRTRRKRRSDT